MQQCLRTVRFGACRARPFLVKREFALRYNRWCSSKEFVEDARLDAQFEQLAMDLGSAPERVLKAHSSDKVGHLLADPRTAPERTGLSPPISGKTHSMPTHDSLGPDDGYGAKNARAATIEPDEQSAVDPRRYGADAKVSILFHRFGIFEQAQSNLRATSLRYQARMVSGRATLGTSPRTRRPNR
jgi:hypothetical protein